MSTAQCGRCGRTICWAEQQFQFVRLLRAGLSREEAKRMMPLCHRCISAELDERGLWDG
jgi:hypothetical protein